MDGTDNNRQNLMRRLSVWLLSLGTLILLASGCGSSPQAEAAQPLAQASFSNAGAETGSANESASNASDDAAQGEQAAAEQAAAEQAAAEQAAAEQAEAERAAADGAIERLLGKAGDTAATDVGDAEQQVTELRQHLAAALLPPGAEADEQALAAAIVARLGSDYEGEQDLATLIDALAAEVADGAPIGSVDELVDRLDDWAQTGVVSFGPIADAAATITSSTPFDDVVDLIGRAGVNIDILPSLAAFEIADAEITVDEAARRITVQGQLPSPLSGTATVTMEWTGAQPRFAIDVNAGDVTLAELLPAANLGSLGNVGASGVELRVDEAGISGVANMIASSIPGLEALNLGSVAVPVELASIGLGPWAAAGSIEPVSISVPLGELPRHGSWNSNRSGVVQLTLGANPIVGYEERVVAQFGGDEVVFVGSGVVSGEQLQLVLTMDDSWVAPFGTTWLTLSDVELEAGGSAAEQGAVVRGNYTIGAKTGRLEFAVGSDGGTQATVTGTLDNLSPRDLSDLAQTLTGSDFLPAGFALPSDVLDLRNVEISFATGDSGRTFSLGATTELLGQTADAALSIVPAADGSSVAIVAVQPRDVALTRLVPALQGNEIVGDLRLPNSAFVFTSRDLQLAAEALDGRMASYLGATGGGSFRLPSGISLAGAIPGGVAPALDDMKAALGIDPAAAIRLGGTLPVGALNGGGGDVVLDASLPTMSPSGSPEWFVDSTLALRISSAPSVGIVGSITLDIKGDVQTFEVDASVERGPAGISVAFVGRLGNPWETPFDVSWLTLNEVVLKLAMEPARGATIGFLGDMIIGEKDLRGAVAITVSPAGVPTNFIFEAASDDGVSLGDLATLYSKMSGQARPPVEAVLPAVEIRKIELRFAPVGDADLGVEQGFKVAGELWMASAVNGPLELIAATDVEVSDRGIIADGYLNEFALGPVEFDQTIIALAVTPEQQRLAFSGGIEVAGSGANVAIEVTKAEMSFATTATFGESQATLEIASSYDLTNPNWRVRAIMNEQFIQDVDVATQALLGQKISDLNKQIDNAKKGLDTSQDLLSAAKVALDVAETATGWCGKFCGNDKVRGLRADVDRLSNQVRDYQNKVDQGQALLKQYDVQLTIVGAEFEAAFGALGSNQITLNLIIDANGYRVPAPTAWDFDKSIDTNLKGVIDQLAALG